MRLVGNIAKLKSAMQQPIHYWLPIADQLIDFNSLIGAPLQLALTGVIHCIQCGRKTSKSFQQGYCYPCYKRLLECDCIIHPERCKIYQGKCDSHDWAHAHCAQPQIVYLANTSGVKVGVTRETQIPTRWIDQGATQGLPIFRVQNRYQAGLIEVILKKHVADKTDWRKMLKGYNANIDLIREKQHLLEVTEQNLKVIQQQFPGEIEQLDCQQITEILYPVERYPTSVIPLSFDKTPFVSGRLQGIKGQYLIFDTGVINMRKFAGYELIFDSDILLK